MDNDSLVPAPLILTSETFTQVELVTLRELFSLPEVQKLLRILYTRSILKRTTLAAGQSHIDMVRTLAASDGQLELINLLAQYNFEEV